MKYLFRWVISIAIIAAAIGIISYNHHKPKVSPWLIDHPIYGIRLGDTLKNLPEGYTEDGVDRRLSIFEPKYPVYNYKSSFDEIERVYITVPEEEYISQLSFYFKKPSLETYTTIVNAFEKKYKAVKQNRELFRQLSKSLKYACYTIELNGKEVLVEISYRTYRDEISVAFPDSVSIEYIHKNLMDISRMKLQ